MPNPPFLYLNIISIMVYFENSKSIGEYRKNGILMFFTKKCILNQKKTAPDLGAVFYLMSINSYLLTFFFTTVVSSSVN